MLIDWPDHKERLAFAIQRAIERFVNRNTPISAQARQFTIEEGRNAAQVGPNGTRIEMQLERHEAQATIPRERLLALAAGTVDDAIREIGEEFAMQREKAFLERVRDAARSHGGSFRGSTPEELKEKMLEALESIDVSFDSAGNPEISLVTHPDNADALYALNADPELELRWERILREKRDEWSRREGRRRLVD